MGRMIMLIGGLILGLSACDDKNPVLFDGQKYKTRVETPRKDRSDFTVMVRDAAGNLDAAQRAGRYAALIHCTSTFGSSEIKWEASGTVAPDQLQPQADGTLVLQGRCIYR